MFPVAPVVFFNIFELSRKDACAKAASGVCNFILIAGVVKVGRKELADGSPRRYDALDFFTSHSNFCLCLTMAIFYRKIVWTALDSKLRRKKTGKARFAPATHVVTNDIIKNKLRYYTYFLKQK